MGEGLYLGQSYGNNERILLDPDHLTTHAVCLGMTGSGKTGLGIVAMEELAALSIPLLIIDLKGDMVDLLLNFPDFAVEDFLKWLPPDGRGNREEEARAQTELWKKGLERSGVAPDRMRKTRDGLKWQLLTPGYASGNPLDILPSFSAPAGWSPRNDPDGARQRVNGLTSALLSLIDRGGDPLSDPDHVLIASIILKIWENGEALDLAGLLGRIIDPPIDKLGALPLEVFYPRERRMKLVLELNTLLASPSFAAWTQGIPLDMDHLLGTPDQPRGRASELVAWMRQKPASSGLSALMYIDEVQGILPPHPGNPPTKAPLLTLLKQGRAFGVGLWLATQNPVDLDYKALGNAGIKLIGRLITERDRERAMEGLGLSGSDEQIEELITGLAKRQFVLHDIRAKESIQSFSSRWAISYLRGPITIHEMQPFFESKIDEAPNPIPDTSVAPSPATDKSISSRPPVMGYTLPTLFDPAGGTVRASLLCEISLGILRKTLKLEREFQEYWSIPIDDDGNFLWEDAEKLETWPEGLDSPHPGSVFPSTAPPALSKKLKTAERELVRWRARHSLMVLANRKLHCIAEESESREEFISRCIEIADQADDAQEEKVRLRYEKKIAAAKKRLERERDELIRDQAQLDARKAEEKIGVVEGLFSVLLGSRSLRSAAGKTGTLLRSSSGRHRMRQRAEGAVIESEHEIQRIEKELEELTNSGLQQELKAITKSSEEKAKQVEEVKVRPRQNEITPGKILLYWRSIRSSS